MLVETFTGVEAPVAELTPVGEYSEMRPLVSGLVTFCCEAFIAHRAPVDSSFTALQVNK